MWLGGLEEASEFNRLYLIRGMGHGTHRHVGYIDAETMLQARPDDVPLPAKKGGRDQLFDALMKWVENQVPPERIDLASADGSVALPICPYPQKATYIGSGSPKGTENYKCLAD